jgi:hypothetical protein
MRKLILCLAIVMLPALPAMAQSTTRAPVQAAGEEGADGNWLAIGAGAIGGLVLLNIATGGAVMVPILGASLAQGAGGNLLFGGAMAPAARRLACRTAAILSTAVAGGFIGDWLYGN